MLYSICENKSKLIMFVTMKNLSKLSLLAAGAVLATLSTPANAAEVGKITLAGDATITDTAITFANNSAFISSTFFTPGSTDSNGNPLPDLALSGPVTVNPITLPTFGSNGDGTPTSQMSPLISNHVKFFPDPLTGTNGVNLGTGNRFVGGTFSGRWEATTTDGKKYSFPGSVDFSAQGTPGNQSFSVSGFANDPVTQVPEPMTILGTGLALAALPKLKKAHSKKKA